jgi:hypothetical protein
MQGLDPARLVGNYALCMIYQGETWMLDSPDGVGAPWGRAVSSAEHKLRLALEVEPAGALSGQSAARLALHLAHAGRPTQALAIITAGREAPPTIGPVNSLGT